MSSNEYKKGFVHVYLFFYLPVGLGRGLQGRTVPGHNALCSDGWNGRLPEPALEVGGWPEAGTGLEPWLAGPARQVPGPPELL